MMKTIMVKVVCAIAFALAISIVHLSSSPAPRAGTIPPADLIDSQENPSAMDHHNRNKRVISRFLADKGPANYYLPAASHCNKDGEVCLAGEYGASGKSTCCKNKCVNLNYDNKNCGDCGNKCKYTQACCQGKCVYLTYDKSHCGACHHKCGKGQPCLYGMCSYA